MNILGKTGRLPRTETRRQRYDKKQEIAFSYPVSICTIHYLRDDNLGHVVRASACFGAKFLDVVGSHPLEKRLREQSASTLPYVDINWFSSIEQFTQERKDCDIICAELCTESRPINHHVFDLSKHTCIIVGNEESGVPGVLTERYPSIYIPMNGSGYCLNTAQTANVLLYEYTRQYSQQNS